MANKIIAHPRTDTCDLCEKSLRSGPFYFDAHIPAVGQWAWVCAECAALNGVRVGLGVGQRYNSKTNEKEA